MTTSDSKRFAAAVLVILSSIGLLVSFGEVAASIALPRQLTVRIPVTIVVSLVLLSGACFILREVSALWQVPLQAFATAFVAMGAAVLGVTAFTNWHLLFGHLGFVGLLALIAALGAGLLMRYLQARLLCKQDA